MNNTELQNNYFPESNVIIDEPWCDLHAGDKLMRWNKEDEIKWNQTHRQRSKYKYYIDAFDFIKENNVKGHYFEFGCHRVRTFRMALTEAYRHQMDDMYFYAFDSFAGLPENKGDHKLGDKWKHGQLFTSEESFFKIVNKHNIYRENIYAYKGYYNDTLNNELSNQIKNKGGLASLICIDCDLYESAVPCFSFIENMIQEGTVIYIDDYWSGYKGNPNKGVSRAFNEYKISSNWMFGEYLDIGAFGKSYIAYK
jgi:hypothetical protein